MATSYYLPLKEPDEIRILTLLPYEQDADEPIQCRFEHVRLAQRPQYEALSYTWGDQTNQHPVGIDTAGNVVHVGQNCLLALRTLRKEEVTRLLWVDALCINQSDQDEKASQIPIIGDVYKCATQTIIFLQYCGPDKVFHSKGAGPELQRSWDSRLLEQESGSPVLDEAARKELFNVTNYAWFHRVWIIQETLLSFSITVVCPPFTWSWEEFASLAMGGLRKPDVMRLNDGYWVNKSNSGGWNHVWDGQLGQRNAGDMLPSQALAYLIDTCEFQCSVYNDRVYSIFKEQVHAYLTGALIETGESRFFNATNRKSWRVDWDYAPNELVSNDVRYLATMRSMFAARKETKWSRIAFKIGEVTRISQSRLSRDDNDNMRQRWTDIMAELGLPCDETESGKYPAIHVQKRNRANVPWNHDWVGEVKGDGTADEHDVQGTKVVHGASAAFFHDRPAFFCENEGIVGIGTQG
ncbi:Heterokaryon incompatibility protein 6,OR allele [Lachnellula subtilissima]|uniref:Heterokaryon incompatibility protein 6,OR allele n=1 Tax=Lachnellula subtilissima TaxID=602034 RepID=A0A8H8RYQ7_9HELO|nr:Heterokaryon incompatibility protein 6,OR allele [Lachnellula subtilissima]